MQRQLEAIGRHMGGEVEAIRLEYDQLFEELLRVLNNNAKGMSSENLRFLAFRLDFNEFYKNKQQAGSR